MTPTAAEDDALVARLKAHCTTSAWDFEPTAQQAAARIAAMQKELEWLRLGKGTVLATHTQIMDMAAMRSRIAELELALSAYAPHEHYDALARNNFRLQTELDAAEAALAERDGLLRKVRMECEAVRDYNPFARQILAMFDAALAYAPDESKKKVTP